MEKPVLKLVLLAYTDARLSDTAESLCRQKASAFEVRLIFADAVCSQTSRSCFDRLSEKFTAEYVPVQSSEQCGEEHCLDAAVSRLAGSAFMIIRSGTVFLDGALAQVCRTLSGGADIVSLIPKTSFKKASRLSKSFLPKSTDLLRFKPSPGYAAFSEQPEAAHGAVDAYAFSARLSEGLEADVPLHGEALQRLLLTLLSRADGCTYITEQTCIISTPLEYDVEFFGAQHEEWWYLPSLTGFFIPFLRSMRDSGRLSRGVQYAVVNLLMAKIFDNIGDKNKCVLTGGQIDEFYRLTAQALCFIENSVFIRWANIHRWSVGNEMNKVYFNRAMITALLRLKAELCGGSLSVTDDGGAVWLATPGEQPVRFCAADEEVIDVAVINYENGELWIDAVFSAGDIFRPEDISIHVECGTDIRPAEISPVYPLLKCFGETFAHTFNIRFSIPAEIGTSARPVWSVNGTVHPVRFSFSKEFSRLVTGRNQSYWCFEKGRCLCCPDGTFLRVDRLTAPGHIKRELRLLTAMRSFNCPNRALRLGSIAIRCLYRVTKPFYAGKRRWITFDKLYKGGDNGEYFFRYSQKRRDRVKVYYIVNSSTKEYKELKKKYHGRVLKSVSVRTMLTALNCEAVAATHATVISYMGFPRSSQPFLRDLFNFKICCIQHGLTVQQLAQFQNRVFDNTTLYCLASPYEHRNLMKPIYGFEERHLKMTGLARFDGLKNNDRRFILITPTWRRNVVASGIANIKKAHCDTFKSSEYFRLYNTLINDQRLIECARKNGYGITYLLHPAMSAQIDDFDRNDYVSLVPATGNMSYEKILTEASLMVTDYSGVQFDFAYMRKPVVYYHPDTLPPQYESGSIDYPTTGFGPICTTNDSLVDTLCSYMENGCENTPEYIARADAFFAYSDYKSCERIYNEMLEFTKEK